MIIDARCFFKLQQEKNWFLVDKTAKIVYNYAMTKAS